jgi:hypothetical protein
MDTPTPPKAAPDGQCCPFLQPAQADWIYPVAGYCGGLPQGLLMIPSVEEFRSLCSTEDHGTCLFYRYRQGDTKVEDLLQSKFRAMRRFSPLVGLFGSRPESRIGEASR